ncbi:carboxymuconolactone decarboxylase family protein [Allobranchiibius sp. GilTou38]|uniref:carboxymuconolactone decarboxylase family protein n=1 Tax=Allobranchiibius sp. GilTou38 TaxID=2815210 RepID=UPI001AA14974|nr:carboxymuconolactone decarboxylase family protein [Allobranchiibius sp. GilTou38]MBO1766741.1 hypothetical protein [Allobranchiibius sp. GilTou38]
MTVGPDRLPMPPTEVLSPEQADAVDEIVAGPRGALVGPFVPMLRAPQLMTRVQRVGEYLRYSSSLDDDLFELIVLLVARHWDQSFEWGHHHPLALASGVPASVVEDVESGRAPSGGRPEIALVARAVTSLLGTGQVDDQTYDEMERAMGDQALVEAVATVGYYTTLALVMNVARTPAPSDAPALSARSSDR